MQADIQNQCGKNKDLRKYKLNRSEEENTSAEKVEEGEGVFLSKDKRISKIKSS